MQIKRLLLMTIAVVGMSVAMNSCAKDGEDGKDGAKGEKGDKGEQGDKGDKGDPGATPTIAISDDGFWVINGEATTVPATGQAGADGENGENGEDGLTPTVEISVDGFWVINGVKTDVKAQGPAGPAGPAGPTNTFVVTFIAEGSPNTTQTVLRGGWAVEPKLPEKFIAAGLYDDFNHAPGWYAAGAGEPFNFTTPITASTTLTAKWQTNSYPVDLSGTAGANLVVQAINFVKANAAADKTYTLAIDEDYVIGSQQSFNVGYVNLTLIGLGRERVIRSSITSGSQTLYVANASASLTLGNNITLKGLDGTSINNLIYVVSGTLTMEPGSKITEHITTSSSGAVYMYGPNARFVMNGGEICGNKSTSNSNWATGGVDFTSGATFTMTGGKITGNTFGTPARPADVLLYGGSNLTATLSGAAAVGTVKITAATTVNSSITIDHYTPAVRPVIDLVTDIGTHPISTAKTNWTGKQVLKAAPGATLTAADVAKFQLGLFIGSSNTETEAISDSYKIGNSGDDMGLLVAKE